jgi:hypothetical protein
MADQEVKARLTIEKEGDGQVFEETAESIRSLSTGAGESVSPIAELSSQLEQMAESAAELGPVAQGAVREFAQAIKEAASAPDIEKQREALSRATTAWKTFGAEAAKAGDLPKKSLKELQDQIAALEKRERELADPLTQAAEEASKALREIGASAEKGFEGAEKQLVDARRRIDDYKRALSEARAAGQNVTGAQVAELQRLESAYTATTRQIQSFRATQASVRADLNRTNAEIRQQASSVSSLGDVVSLQGPKWKAFIQVAGGIVGAFSAGYAAGQKLRSVLNDLTDGGFDRATQEILKMADAAEVLVGSSDRAADRIRLLANQKNIFENLGLEGFTQDVEANTRVLAEYQLQIKKVNDAYDDFIQKQGLSRAELDKQAAALGQNIRVFEDANKQLSQQDLAALFKKQIQEILDSYERLGFRAPRIIREIAEAWNITTSATEVANARVKEAAEGILSAILGVSAKTRAELQQDAKAIEAAFSSIRIQNLDFSQFERAQQELRRVIDEFTAAGVKIPESLAKIASQFIVYQNAAGLVASANDEAGLSIEQLMARYGRAGAASEAAAAGARSHASAVRSSIEPVASHSAALSQSAGAAQQAGAQMGAAAGQIDQAADSSRGLSQASREVSFGPIVTELTQLQQVVKTTSQALSTEFAAAFRLVAAASQGFSGPILVELERIISKAIEAKAALAEVEA